MNSALEFQRAVTLVAEGLRLANSTDPEVWADWRDRSTRFLQDLRQAAHREVGAAQAIELHENGGIPG